METFSHSRINTFETCPLQYKLKYIQKAKTSHRTTIEGFMGSLVHDSLEKLYKDLKFEKKYQLSDYIKFYNKTWDAEFDSDILIVRYDAESFRAMGEKYLRTYFNTHEIDAAHNIALEKHVTFNLAPGVTIQGYIDRLDSHGDVYEIHDYKTSGTLPTKEYMKKDRQLGLYSIAVKQDYPDAKRIRLIWHYLAFGKDIETEKTDLEIKELKEWTIDKVREIGKCKEFEPKVSALCSWCLFQPLCPRFAHKFKDSGLNKFIEDDGKALAEKYTELSKEKKKIESDMDELKTAIIDYCQKNQVTDLFGDKTKIAWRRYKNFKFPGKDHPLAKELIDVLKNAGLIDEYMVIDNFKLSKAMNQGTLPAEIIEILKNFAQESTTDRIYSD